MFTIARNEANKPFKATPANAGDVRDASMIPWLQPMPVFLPGESQEQRIQSRVSQRVGHN